MKATCGKHSTRRSINCEFGTLRQSPAPARVSFELNGNTEFFHNESAGTGCLSGNYRFLTAVPVQLNPGGFETYDVAAGELRVNHSLLARFSESDPRLTMRIGLNTFTSDPSGGALTSIARCFP